MTRAERTQIISYMSSHYEAIRIHRDGQITGVSTDDGGRGPRLLIGDVEQALMEINARKS